MTVCLLKFPLPFVQTSNLGYFQPLLRLEVSMWLKFLYRNTNRSALSNSHLAGFYTFFFLEIRERIRSYPGSDWASRPKDAWICVGWSGEIDPADRNSWSITVIWANNLLCQTTTAFSVLTYPNQLKWLSRAFGVI